MERIQVKSETSSRIKELDQSRKIFIDLLRDNRALLELGYTEKQAEYALPIAALLQGQGKEALSPHPPHHHFVDFINPTMPKAQARIEELTSKQGFILSATRLLSNRHDLKAVKKAIHEDHVFPVPSWTPEVVRIGLFKQNADINNLNFLVRQLITNWIFVSPPLGIKPRNPNTQLTELAGLNSTFKAAWIDPKVKSEFVVELSSPRLKTGPEKVAFKRLISISNPNGGYIPFGMKANLAS